MEVEHQVFILYENFVDPLETFPYLTKYNLPKVVAEVSIRKIFAAIHGNFPGERSFSDGNPTCATWAPIVFFGDTLKDFEARTSGKTRYKRLPKLLMDGIEREKDTVETTVRREFLDVLIGTVDDLLGLGKDGRDEYWCSAKEIRRIAILRGMSDRAGWL